MNEFSGTEPVPTGSNLEHAMWADVLSEVLGDIIASVDTICGQVNDVMLAVLARNEALEAIKVLIARYESEPDAKAMLEEAQATLTQSQKAYKDLMSDFSIATYKAEDSEGMQQVFVVTSEVLQPLAKSQPVNDEIPVNALKDAVVSIDLAPLLVSDLGRQVRLHVHEAQDRLPSDSVHVGPELQTRINSFKASQTEVNRQALRRELASVEAILEVDTETAVGLDGVRMELRKPLDEQISRIRGVITVLRTSANQAVKLDRKPVTYARNLQFPY